MVMVVWVPSSHLLQDPTLSSLDIVYNQEQEVIAAQLTLLPHQAQIILMSQKRKDFVRLVVELTKALGVLLCVSKIAGRTRDYLVWWLMC
jgi:hypothetical protein